MGMQNKNRGGKIADINYLEDINKKWYRYIISRVSFFQMNYGKVNKVEEGSTKNYKGELEEEMKS